MNKRKIFYITGTRADYGLMRSVLFAINNHPKMDLELVVTGMHLMDDFGFTIDEIIADSFKIHALNTVFEEDNKFSMTNYLGKLIILLTDYIKCNKPDFILLLGDRAEMLAGAVVGTYLSIPVAHIHGGDVTSTVDEHARHAITKLSHIHFAATEKSAERIIKMGEEDWRVTIVGSPASESLLKEKIIDPKNIAEKYSLDLSRPIILVIQHPVTIGYNTSAAQIKETLDAIVDLGYQTILIFPNADAGGRSMIEMIKEYKYPFLSCFNSIPRADYLSIMNIASVMVGNSSSGIVEAPFLQLPVINIGSRQEGRERGKNVLDVKYNKNEIKEAISSILSKKRSFNVSENPYYSKVNTSSKIVEILSTTKIDDKLLQKKLTY
jgi:GDP/UDP-N,N'-diacetylbacillosamine 2-epimerase (hydrolysing)